MDDRLRPLMDDMNKARGSVIVDRMAAVINELVAQRKQAREDMKCDDAEGDGALHRLVRK